MAFQSPYYASAYRSRYSTSAASAAKCTIQWDDDVVAYIVSTPYSQQFVEFIKLAIPVSDRAWDAEKKVWYIKEAYFSVIKDVALKVWSFDQVIIITKADVAAQQAKKTSVERVSKAPFEQVCLDFVKIIPKAVLKKAYLLAANELHPDKNGGDGSKMAALNNLWSRIESETK